MCVWDAINSHYTHQCHPTSLDVEWVDFPPGSVGRVQCSMLIRLTVVAQTTASKKNKNHTVMSTLFSSPEGEVMGLALSPMVKLKNNPPPSSDPTEQSTSTH